MRAKTSSGFRSSAASGPIPSRSQTPGAERVDEHVGTGDQVEREREPGLGLEVDRDRPPAAREELGRDAVRSGRGHVRRPIDAHHVGSEVGEQHAPELGGPDPGELDHPEPRQRARRCSEEVD